ncbi:MAG: hypothetical protein ABEK50_16225 [bacterium]
MSTVSRTTCLVIALLMIPAIAFGAGTQIWEISGLKSWLKGDFQGTGLTSRGNIIPTLNTTSDPVKARLVWQAQPVRTDRRVVLGTSLPSKLLMNYPDTKPTVLKKTDGLGFTALHRFNGYIYAAESPSGRVYRVDTRRDTAIHVTTLPDSYVWSMTTGSNGQHLYLGSGPRGKIYRLSSSGTYSIVTEVDGHNVLSLAVFNETLYAGDDYGGLYKVKHRTRSHSIYGFSHGEVASLASDQDFLYVGVNKRAGGDDSKRKRSQLARRLRKQAMKQRARQRLNQLHEKKQKQAPIPGQQRTSPQPGKPVPSLPKAKPSPASGKRPDLPQRRTQPKRTTQPRQNRRPSPTMLKAIRKATQQQDSKLFGGLAGNIVYRMKPPEEMNVIYNDQNEIVHELEARKGTVYIATGGKGRLYKILPDFTRIAYLETPHKMVLDVNTQNGLPSYVATGEGGSLVTTQSFEHSANTYRSSVMDAQLLSRWGTLKWTGQGTISVRTRSGNRSSPDTGWNSWSDWQQARTFSVPSKPARFLQFEIRFDNRDASLKNLQIAFKIPNQRPRIARTMISPNPNRQTKSPFQSRQHQQSQKQQPPRKPPGQPPSQHGNSSMPDSVRQIQWNSVDPDGDDLHTFLSYRTANSERWISFTGDNPLQNPGYTWKTNSFSDGWYELKLSVTDKPSNPPGHSFTTEHVFGPVLVDNSSPEFHEVKVSRQSDSAVSIQFTAVDSTSWINQCEFRVNGNDWRTLEPKDGILDEIQEQFQDTLKGIHRNDVLELRISDENGNTQLLRPAP